MLSARIFLQCGDDLSMQGISAFCPVQWSAFPGDAHSTGTSAGSIPAASTIKVKRLTQDFVGGPFCFDDADDGIEAADWKGCRNTAGGHNSQKSRFAHPFGSQFRLKHVALLYAAGNPFQ